MSRSEYESKSLDDLDSDARKILIQVKAIDAQVKKLETEKAALLEKQETAGQALQQVEDARQELENAQAALEEQQGESFIKGQSIDISPYQARAGKAKERYEALHKDAAAGKAALPKIANRLEAIGEDIEEFGETRKSLYVAWLVNYRRSLEVSIKETSNNLARDVSFLGAIGRQTGSPISEIVLDSYKRGLVVPVYGNRMEQVDFTRYIGAAVVPDYTAIVNHLSSEFERGVATHGG